MPVVIPDILGRIVDRKREELRDLRATVPQLEKRAEAAMRHRRPFARALRTAKPAIIAEIKHGSPSKGILVTDYDPVRTALAYQAGGAAALSVLTDRDFFHGDLAHMEAARAAVRLPVLRKDFTIGEVHVVQAAAHGADAILLIAAILSACELQRLRELAAKYLMAAIVEVHDAEDLHKAVCSGAGLIGVNNRDLRTFETRLETSLDLAPQMPANAIRISESGIGTVEDVRRLSAAGYHGFLVGEHLMRSADPARAVEELRCL